MRMTIDICVLAFILMSAVMFLAIVGGCMHDYFMHYYGRDMEIEEDGQK